MPSKAPAGPLWKVCAAVADEAHMQNDMETAEHQYKLSLVFAQHAHGNHHESVAEALINLADFYVAAERWDDAKLLYRRAVDLYDRLFGRDNLVTEMIYRLLAQICYLQNRTSEAAALRVRAFAILSHRHAS